MILLWYLLYSFFGIYVLWIFYLAVMNLKRARDNGTLTGISKIFGLPVVFVGTSIDTIINWTVCTVLFLELPREWTVTSRLKRLIPNVGWRSDLAAWFCGKLLNAFDPSGNHCK